MKWLISADIINKILQDQAADCVILPTSSTTCATPCRDGREHEHAFGRVAHCYCDEFICGMAQSSYQQDRDNVSQEYFKH